ncbi:hypothetical protein [Burkholderia sp. RF4-BP95]|uniref:hypothetical protein n=1 Tax=Burkholderia sp. RF4-BP95 TaxID=1637845 RepID=UPI0012E38E4C|nr:hypothetical protein [Burkholderia sp. RF4-BP95]
MVDNLRVGRGVDKEYVRPGHSASRPPDDAPHLRHRDVRHAHHTVNRSLANCASGTPAATAISRASPLS